VLPRVARWPANIGIITINSLLIKLMAPLAPYTVALWAEQTHSGALHQLPPSWSSSPITIILCILVFDLFIYGQHVLSHRVPLLWRIHRMHHLDQDLDTTSGIRFHPLEILCSLCAKSALVALLGIPSISVLIFEIALNAAALFNHSNGKLPCDHTLRRWIVTPDMHRIHHSIIPHETNSNYGFLLSCWDRLWGTYCQTPNASHATIPLGIAPDPPSPHMHTLAYLLLCPFKPDRNKKNGSDL
jgi:sterol desaturase/sphingolipid hydroxylase (fatty acid hydroxylase superfamily)